MIRKLVRGCGNVFRDLRRKNADVEQFKAILAAEIIKALDREHLTVRAALTTEPRKRRPTFLTHPHADLGRFPSIASCRSSPARDLAH